MNWHKIIPPKKAHEALGVYNGTWSKLMDRCWECDEGYAVQSRQLRTDWGTVEHVTINRIGGGGRGGDVPWAVKQQIKNELFGNRRIAIEVFPDERNLIDVMDVYHLWVLPKDFKMPFGIHPFRDNLGKPVERGYDYNLEDNCAWVESPERKAMLYGLSE